MNLVIIVLILIALLFALAFFTKRRFGVLGLALAAGAMLSKTWASDLTPYVKDAGIQLVAPPLESVVASVLILLPAVLLLFSGPTYHVMWQKLLGSAAFALLALSFLLEPLAGALVLSGDSRTVYNFLIEYRTWIITGGIVYALIDLLMVRTPKHSGDKH